MNKNFPISLLKRCILNKRFHVFMIIFSLGGILSGIFLKEYQFIYEQTGKVFISLLSMIIIPLIFSSIINSIISLGNKKDVESLGFKTFFTFLLTTLLASTVGIIGSLLLKPGQSLKKTALKTETIINSPDSIVQIFTDIIPENIFKALFNGQTVSVIFFAIVLGLVLINIKENSKTNTLYNWIHSFNKSMEKLTQWIINIAPIGVFFILAGIISKVGLTVIQSLITFILISILLLIIYFIIQCIIVFIFANKNPFELIKEVFPALTTAFSTDSSIITIPVTMNCLEKRSHINKNKISFIIPLGATVNMNGTALFIASTSIFISQAYQINLQLKELAIILMASSLTAIATAGIPGSSLITMGFLLQILNLPLASISLIMSVDRIIDMCRTVINVFGDIITTQIINSKTRTHTDLTPSN